jgi:hypothetical protein
MSLAPAARRAVRARLPLALGALVAALPATLAAQHVVGADVNAAAETAVQPTPDGDNSGNSALLASHWSF